MVNRFEVRNFIERLMLKDAEAERPSTGRRSKSVIPQIQINSPINFWFP
jgi:hypothetical protein